MVTRSLWVPNFRSVERVRDFLRYTDMRKPVRVMHPDDFDKLSAPVTTRNPGVIR